jgi:hypothetical protein
VINLPEWSTHAVQIAGIGMAISDLELLTLHKELRTRGILHEPTRSRSGTSWVSNLSRFPVAWLLAVRIILISGLFLKAPATLNCVLILLLTLISLGIQRRRFLGSNGSDNVICIIFTSISTAILFRTPHAFDVVAYFLAAYLSIVYLTASLAKLMGKGWRSGDALRQILSTGVFGRQSLFRYMHRYPSISKILSYAVIAGEFSFALGPWLPSPWSINILVAAVLFHLVLAIVMGLNTFFFAFAGLLFAAEHSSALLWPR